MSSLHHSAQTEASLEALCVKKGLRMTCARRTIARVLADSSDHPDVQEIHRRARAQDERISLATVYRTLRAFYEIGVLERHAFAADSIKSGEKRRWRYEPGDKQDHYHLIDIKNGKVIEFESAELAKLQKTIARKLGYQLDSYRTELYGIQLKQKRGDKKASKR